VYDVDIDEDKAVTSILIKVKATDDDKFVSNCFPAVQTFWCCFCYAINMHIFYLFELTPKSYLKNTIYMYV